MRIKKPRECNWCGREYFRHNGNVNSKYCSVKCSLTRIHHTPGHQAYAGHFAALVINIRKQIMKGKKILNPISTTMPQYGMFFFGTDTVTRVLRTNGVLTYQTKPLPPLKN